MSFAQLKKKLNEFMTSAMNGHLLDVEANLIVKLGETDMTVGDLITLDVGDIIPLNREASGEVDVTVEGVEKMKCLMGVFKGNRAVQITKVEKE